MRKIRRLPTAAQQNFLNEVHLGQPSDVEWTRWIVLSGLAVAIGISYFLAARLGLALLAKPEGVAVFWPAGGISAGMTIALGAWARGPVIAGTFAATIVANLLGDRSAM